MANRPKPNKLVPLSPAERSARASITIPASAPVAAPARAVTVGLLLRALGRCWPVAVPLGLVLGVGAAAGVWTLRPDKSTTSTLLRVNQGDERVLRDPSRPDSNAGFARAQLALLIRSRAVLREALQDERVRQLPILAKQPDPVEWLEKELRPELIDGTEYIRVTLASRGDAADLAPILNAVAKTYQEKVGSTENAEQRRTLNDLEKAYNVAEEGVRRTQELISGLSRSMSSGDKEVLSYKQRALVEEWVATRRLLQDVNSQLRKLEVQRGSYLSRLADPATAGSAAGGPAFGLLVAPETLGADPAVERDVDADPRVAALEAQLGQLREQLARLDGLVVPGTESPARTKLEAQVQRAVAELATARQAKRVLIAERYQRIGKSAVVGQLRDVEVEAATLKRQKDSLQQEVEAQRKEVEKLGGSTVDLELKRHELERGEQLLKSIWEQKERLGIELKAVARQRVSVWAPAEEASVLNRNGRMQEAAVAGLGGLLVGLLGAAIWDVRRGRIHSLTDVTEGLRLPVVGSLPSLDGKSAGSLLTAPAGDERAALALAESADGIRTLLLHDHLGERGVTLMIASPSPGEGKSTLAASLAASIARSGRRTLLVDGDLRRPTLHALFGLPVGPGLTAVLAGDAQAEDVIVPTAVANLSLLPAGEFSAEAVAGLARPAGRAAFAWLREHFDFVIIDSSPLLCVPDGFMMGRWADGLLFSVRPGLSQAAEVTAGYERVRDHRLPFAGVVVNGMTKPTRYYRGYDRLPAATTALAVAPQN